jgi:hypothetical protein
VIFSLKKQQKNHDKAENGRKRDHKDQIKISVKKLTQFGAKIAVSHN